MRSALTLGARLLAVAALGTFVACSNEKKTEDVGKHVVVEQVDGRPENFERGDAACYAVWHQKDAGWHLAVTSAGLRRHFKGRIWMEGGGKFGAISQWKASGEVAAEAAEGNWFFKKVRRAEGDHEIVFDLVEENKNLSGISFEVEGAGPLKWDLWIGGADEKDPSVREPKHVKIGHDGGYPPSVPFETFAHPDERGKGH